MILCDGHVHIYDCYDLDTFFTAAFQNFSHAAAQQQKKSPPTCFMLLAEATGVYYFKKLQDVARSGDTPGTPWRAEETDETDGLYLFHKDFPSMRLIVAAGRQIITKEKLEILALMTAHDFEDGMTLERTVEAVIAAGGIPVCPWGVGKWLGTRGQVLTKYMLNKSGLLYLGDNGGRPSFWPRPSLFKGDTVEKKLLSGSDPLPLSNEEGKAGQFGTLIDCDCPEERPVTFLRDELKKYERELTGFGRLCCPLTFFKNQVALRMR